MLGNIGGGGGGLEWVEWLLLGRVESESHTYAFLRISINEMKEYLFVKLYKLYFLTILIYVFANKACFIKIR